MSAQSGSHRSESGFAFIEVVVASLILLIAVVAVGSQLGTQFVSVSTSADQQEAGTLLNQAMEEVRALPFTFVSTGLNPSDPTVTSDTNILVTTSQGQTACKTNNTTIWSPQEVIPCAAPSTQNQAPFTPHTSSVSSARLTYNVSAYPSIDASDTGSGPTVYRVTIIVSWRATHGLQKVVDQTLVFSAASGCLTQTNHPFAAPCQPFLYSSASAGGGYVDVTPDPQTGNAPLAGQPFNSVELLLPQVTSGAEVEQVSTVLGSVKTSQGSIDATNVQTIGGASASLSADNDPGTARAPSAPASVSQSSTNPPLTFPSSPDAGQSSISVQPGSADSGQVVTTSAASTNPVCYDLLGISQLTNLPCGSASVTESGAATLAVNLYAGSVSLGAAPIGTVGATQTYADKTFASRFTQSGGAYCSSTSADGCVHAGAQESLGTVEVSGLPAKFLTDGAAPASWGAGTGACPSGAGDNNYLLAVVNYSAGTSSESGVSAGSPAASVPIAGSGTTPTLCYWTGSGYNALAINWGAGSPPSLTLPSVTATDTVVSSGAVTVTITPTVQLVPVTVASNLPANCASVCTGTATVPSMVQASILYVVTQGGATLADMDINLSLGEVEASTSYQAAP